MRLKAHGTHVVLRLEPRGAPLGTVTHFDPGTSDLVSAEVRTGTGNGEGVVTEGSLYARVGAVNAALMRDA